MTRRRPVEVEGQRLCKNCEAPLGEAGEFCTKDCEVAFLRKQVEERDATLAKYTRKKGPARCLGRVHWATCIQEWYLKDSYDAKRRANELRKLNYEVRATSIGEMPIETEDDVVLAKVTVLTAWKDGSPELAPAPGNFIDGIRANGGQR